MSKKTKQQARLLVESILKEDHLTSQEIIKKLILEAEQEREKQAAQEAGGDEQDIFADDTTEETTDVQGGNEQASEGEEAVMQDEFAEDPGMNNDEVNEVIDDQIQINCQINASVLQDLLNKVAELKTGFENMGLDKHDRQYFEIKVPLQYYSEKLQKLQNKTNPGVDQEQVKKQLDDISISLQELQGTINGGGSSNDTEILSPDEVNASEQGEQIQNEELSDETQKQEQKQNDNSQDKEQQKEQEDKDSEEESTQEQADIFG